MFTIIFDAIRLVFLSFLPVFSASVFPYIRICARGVVSGIVVFSVGVVIFFLGVFCIYVFCIRVCIRKKNGRGIYVIGIIQVLLFRKACPGTGPGPRFTGGTVSGKTEGKEDEGERGTRTEACEKRKGENGNEEKNEEKNDGMRGSRKKVDSTYRKRKRQKERKTEEMEERISRKKNGGKAE